MVGEEAIFHKALLLYHESGRSYTKEELIAAVKAALPEEVLDVDTLTEIVEDVIHGS